MSNTSPNKIGRPTSQLMDIHGDDWLRLSIWHCSALGNSLNLSESLFRKQKCSTCRVQNFKATNIAQSVFYRTRLKRTVLHSDKFNCWTRNSILLLNLVNFPWFENNVSLYLFIQLNCTNTTCLCQYARRNLFKKTAKRHWNYQLLCMISYIKINDLSFYNNIRPYL